MSEQLKAHETEKELLSPCGLFCGVCGIYRAHLADDAGMKEKLAGVFGCRVEEIACKGCLSDHRFFFCRDCDIRACTQNRGYEGCYQCDDFPCRLVNEFPVEIGKKIMLDVVPEWRRLGTEAWLAAEKHRHTCSECGGLVVRGAKRCPDCRHPIGT